MRDDEYFALTEGAGIVDFSARSRLEATGDDRKSFLHKLSTNEVNGLPAGGGCEAFFLDARGHVLGHGFLISSGQSIIIETVGGQNESLLKHLDRYLIREKVELHDRTSEWAELLVAGPRSLEVLNRLTNQVQLPMAPLTCIETAMAGQAALVVYTQMIRPGGYLVLLRDGDSRQTVINALCDQQAMLCGQDAFDAVRIEAGFPFYGQDITDKNLPQEVGRDALAISFRKGCYLGQETVARIDALGHVNKILVKLRFESATAPPAGTELIADEVAVGQVTSAAFSPSKKAAIGLGYVRRGSHEPGTKLASSVGPVMVDGAGGRP